ncbi:hypothetical protein V6N11_050965 [Hibiscus sabdariffa]|uniref:Uncharacterized protein n=1 Tax=Hibiscus sabdariffa TaxID=183260 RepID=A0ABR2R378_9ROSI
MKTVMVPKRTNDFQEREVGGEYALYDDDDEEINSIHTHFKLVYRKIKNKNGTAINLEAQITLDGGLGAIDKNEDCGLGSIDANETCSDENLDNLDKTSVVESAVENEDESKGLSSGEDTGYLDSSDVGSYETDSDGDFISRKNAKVFFDPSTDVPRFELEMILENQKQLKDALYASDVTHRTPDPEGTFDVKVVRPNGVDNPKSKRLYFCFIVLNE